MQVGMIGLGRMGGNMVRRLLAGGHQCVVSASSLATQQEFVALGALPSDDLADFVTRLARPRVVWIMIPAGAVESVIAELAPLLESGDVIIDGGNSNYVDDIRRARELAAAGIHHVDVGVSGGVHGLEHGYCQMIGGEREVVARLVPLFATLAPGQSGDSGEVRGYLHCGPSGAGHFVKMVHNGIEYGLMAAYAEGFNLLRHAGIGLDDRRVDAETAPLESPEHFTYDFDVAAIAELWRHGSVVRSWLLDLTAAALSRDPSLESFGTAVADSGEGRWTVQAAIEAGVPVPTLATALFARFGSRGGEDFANRILSAMRYEFGGHAGPAPSGQG